jgi:SAM-dependent methyltransferase
VWLFASHLTQGDGSDADYPLSSLTEAEAWHFWFRARRRLLVWAVRRYFPAARSFLEVGCGAGVFLAALREARPGMSLTASDLLTRSLAHARQRLPDVPVVQIDARRIPFEAEFDVVGAFDVIEHVTDDEAVLRAVHRSLHGAGGLILTVPQHPILWSAVDDFSGHRRRYTRRELTSKVRSAGFEVIRATSFFSFTLPLLWLRRFTSRAAQSLDLDKELRISRPVNSILASLAALERRLIEWGASVPWGGSLLLVARRGSAPRAAS